MEGSNVASGSYSARARGGAVWGSCGVGQGKASALDGSRWMMRMD
jgi:hypothetical protein